MFRHVEYDFVCLNCEKPNQGSKTVAGQSREEAEQNVMLKSELMCSFCHKPVQAATKFHFSRNDEVSALRNKV